MTPDTVLAELLAGNARFTAGEWSRQDHAPIGPEYAGSQAPIAAVLTCADSRIAPSLIFDVKHDSLFTARVAGNSISDDTLGSVEFAVEMLGVPLVLVLGHQDCGAVKAALDVVAGNASYPPGAIATVVGRCEPAVRSLPDVERSVEACVRANAVHQARDLAGREPVVAPAIAAGRLRVVPAYYEIATGRVNVL
jgi:carbonic anhydrase